MYLILKNSHMVFATVAISGFLLRGYWVMTDSKLRQVRAARIVPHVVDALFLTTGIWLAVILNLNVLQHTWLLAKFAGLFGYIGFGMVAFRFGRTREIRLIAFVAAVASFAYIVGAALAKSPLSWLAY
jgi:uncharacterized membrane protein SirB2